MAYYQIVADCSPYDRKPAFVLKVLGVVRQDMLLLGLAIQGFPPTEMGHLATF